MPLIKGKSQKAFVKNLKTEMEHGHPQKQSLAIAYSMKRKAQHRKKMAEGGVSSSSNQGPGGVQIDPDKLSAFQQGMRSATHAHGGVIHDEDEIMHQEKEADELALGGRVNEKASGYLAMPKEHELSNKQAHEEDDKDLNQHSVDMHASTNPHEDEEVESIMEDESEDLSQEARLAHGGELAGHLSGKHYEDMEDDLVNRIMHKIEKKAFENEARLANGGYLQGNEMYPHAKGKMFDVTNKYSEGGKVANDTEDHKLKYETPNEFDDLVLRDNLESSYGDDDNAGDSLDNKREDHDRSDIISKIMRSRKNKDKLPNPA